MRALRLHDWGEQPRLSDVPVRSPAPDEVVVQVAAAGLCHSDLHVIDAAAGRLPFHPPFTLGHEVAGRIASAAEGRTGSPAEGRTGSAAAAAEADGGEAAVGDAVVVYAPWGCGDCDRCRAGRQNYCDRKEALPAAGIGLGVDGGMAEALVVASSRLIPIGDLDPVTAAPLTDAGLTSYHAISRCRDRLGEGSVAVVVGVGGLGHLATQILRACTPARVVAVDTRTAALDLAERCGAHVAAYAGADAAAAVGAATAGRGADVVLDFVGAAATLAFATEVLRGDGEVSVVGSGGGALTVTKPGGLAPGTRVSVPFWGTQPELVDVVRLARERRLRVETTQFPLSAAEKALDLFRRGEILGRAVLVPD